MWNLEAFGQFNFSGFWIVVIFKLKDSNFSWLWQEFFIIFVYFTNKLSCKQTSDEQLYANNQNLQSCMFACALQTCRKLHCTCCIWSLSGLKEKKNKHVELWTWTDMTVGNKRQNIWHHVRPPSSQDLPFLSHASSLTLSLSSILCSAWGRRCNEDECLRLAANAEHYTWLGAQRLLLKTSQIGRRSDGLQGSIHQQRTCLLCVCAAHASPAESQHCLQPHLPLWKTHNHWTSDTVSRRLHYWMFLLHLFPKTFNNSREPICADFYFRRLKQSKLLSGFLAGKHL